MCGPCIVCQLLALIYYTSVVMEFITIAQHIGLKNGKLYGRCILKKILMCQLIKLHHVALQHKWKNTNTNYVNDIKKCRLITKK